ncbi:MAG: transposase [Treponema sp.]|nr:transposase [Treponema sp.]
MNISIDRYRRGHAHFLAQPVPPYSPAKIVTAIKGNISRKVFEKHPEVKKRLWGGEFWSDGFLLARLANTGMKKQ